MDFNFKLSKFRYGPHVGLCPNSDIEARNVPDVNSKVAALVYENLSQEGQRAQKPGVHCGYNYPHSVFHKTMANLQQIVRVLDNVDHCIRVLLKTKAMTTSPNSLSDTEESTIHHPPRLEGYEV